MPQKPKSAKKEGVMVVIAVNGEMLKGSGATLEKALAGIIPPKKIATKVIMRVTADGRSFERMVKPPLVMKLFSPNPSVREIILKNFKILFGLR